VACGARRISTRMKLAAADAIAQLTQESELVPDPLDRELHRAVADAVSEAARDEGLERPERIPAGLEA
jgi:malate dehydrogenase (oxaloacetate-decarboxylating)